MSLLRGSVSSRWLLLALVLVLAPAQSQTSVALPGGRVYAGDLEDGEPYVSGLWCSKRHRYQGEFVNGYARARRRVSTTRPGEGEWRNDIPHGGVSSGR